MKQKMSNKKETRKLFSCAIKLDFMNVFVFRFFSNNGFFLMSTILNNF